MGRGVRAASRSSIEIDFYYRGVRCKERLKLRPTPANMKYAERLKSEIENGIERGTFDYAVTFPNSRKARLLSHRPGATVAVKTLLRDYLKGAQPTLQASTYEDYYNTIENHLIPQFGTLKLTELTRAAIKAWLAEKKVSKKRQQNLLAPMRNALSDAQADGLIDINPLYGWTPRVQEAPKEKEDVDPFTVEEQRAMIEAADPQVAALIQFGCWTGLRTSELFALEWKDIDWRAGVAKIRRAKVRQAIKPPKTKNGRRDVKLLEPALQALKAQRARSEMVGPTVFLNPRTHKPWLDGKQLIKTEWKATLERAGVRYRYPYQMRHTFASMMCSAGEYPQWIAAQMGHSDGTMVGRVYGRWMPEANPDAGGKAESMW